MTFNLSYWLNVYAGLKKNGDYKIADDLREMMRRMGYKVSNTKNRVIAIEV